MLEKIDKVNRKRLIKFKPMVDVVYEIIKKDIVYGKIEYGSTLSTRRISEELNVSRTPVREAIRKLESEGLIELLSRRGFIVKKYSAEQIEKIYAVRQI